MTGAGPADRIAGMARTQAPRSLPVLPQAPAVRPQRAEGPPAAGRPVVGFVSLGCAKNLVDSERMLGELAESGALLTGDESLADTIVVNTCGFLEAARDEALGVLRELAQRKRAGTLRRIVVAGCLVQRDGTKLLEAVPEIDALVGVNNRDDVVRAVWRLERDERTDLYLGDYHGQPWSDAGRLRLTPRHYAYVRISEGCDQKCTFCTIPSIRGPMHSKPVGQIVAECRELIADGARELILIGQDTTSYGRDIGYETGLAGLLRRLDAECDGARWIRLMYVYPSILGDDVLDAIAESERVVKYIDIPLQHIDDRVLKRMHRRVTRAQTEALLERIRRRIPGVTIRTTFIVGFPGESDEAFEALVRFVRDFGFDAVGAFVYSREPETPAGRMRDQIPDEIKRQRYEQLMLTQQQVAFEKARQWVGRAFEVLIAEAADDSAVGRHAGQAPEVDAVCRVSGADPIEPGAFVPVRCVGSEGYDLRVEPQPMR